MSSVKENIIKIKVLAALIRVNILKHHWRSMNWRIIVSNGRVSEAKYYISGSPAAIIVYSQLISLHQTNGEMVTQVFSFFSYFLGVIPSSWFWKERQMGWMLKRATRLQQGSWCLANTFSFICDDETSPWVADWFSLGNWISSVYFFSSICRFSASLCSITSHLALSSFSCLFRSSISFSRSVV